MATIYITCPYCTADTSMPARAMLATLDLGEFLGPLGQLSWACLSCGRLVIAEVEAAHLLRLITAGVSLIDDGFGAGAVGDENTDSGAPPGPHGQHPGTDPPFTPQDVLTLHELLETDAWSSSSPNHRTAAPEHQSDRGWRRANTSENPGGEATARAGDSVGPTRSAG